MASKKGRPTKKAAGGTRAAKDSTATVRKSAPKKPAPRPAETAARREQPKRLVKRVQNAVEDRASQQPSPPKKRPARKVKAPSQDEEEDERPAPPPKGRSRRNNKAASLDPEETPQASVPSPRASRSKRPAPGDSDSSDDEPLWQHRKKLKASAAEESPDDDQEGAQDPAQQDLRADTAENYPDCNDLTEEEQLAEVEVYRDPERAARLFYRLRFYLNAAEGDDSAEAGYIHAYRIAKTSDTHRTAEHEAWRRDFLPKNVNSIRSEIRETSNCLRALFTLNATPAARNVPDPAIRRNLARNALLFVQMIHIRQQFQRQGLLTPLLEHWQAALQQLPEWFAFRGSIVLVPGKPDSEVSGRVWAEAKLTDVQIEERLTRAYEHQGFAVWARDARVGGAYITVMGRSLDPIPELEEEAGDEGAQQ